MHETKKAEHSTHCSTLAKAHFKKLVLLFDDVSVGGILYLRHRRMHLSFVLCQAILWAVPGFIPSLYTDICPSASHCHHVEMPIVHSVLPLCFCRIVLHPSFRYSDNAFCRAIGSWDQCPGSWRFFLYLYQSPAASFSHWHSMYITATTPLIVCLFISPSKKNHHQTANGSHPSAFRTFCIAIGFSFSCFHNQ